MPKVCFEQAHMTCAEFGLWVQYKKLSHASGRLFCDGRKTAERFEGESKDHIYRLRKSLIEKGWLVPTKHSGTDKKTGRRTAAEFTVLDHQQWAKKQGKMKCKSSLFSEPGPVAPVQMDTESPVAPVQTACRTRANGPVAPARHSTKENQLKENIEIKFASDPSESKANTFFVDMKDRDAETLRLAKTTSAPFASVQMDSPELAEFEGMTSAQIISLIPYKRGMQLYNRTKGVYVKDDAIAEVLKYRKETKEAQSS